LIFRKLAQILTRRRLIQVSVDQPQVEEAPEPERRGFIGLKVLEEEETRTTFLSGYYVSYRWQAFDDINLKAYRLTKRLEKIVTSRAYFLIIADGGILLQRVRDFPPEEVLDQMGSLVAEETGEYIETAVPIESISDEALLRFVTTELASAKAIRFAKVRPANPRPPTTEELVQVINGDAQASSLESVEYSTGVRRGDLLHSKMVIAFGEYARSGYAAIQWVRGLLQGHEESGPVEIGQSRGGKLTISIALPEPLRKANAKLLRVLRALRERSDRE
jgi:hypothetical protein